MLVLSRKSREAVVVGGMGAGERVLKVTVIAIKGGSVRLGFDASHDVPVHRAEVWERIQAENQSVEPEPSGEQSMGTIS
jgi:carbon storage regulator